MRSIGRTNGVSPRTSVAIAIQIPLGQRFSEKNGTGGLCDADVKGVAAHDGQPMQRADSVSTTTLEALPPLGSQADSVNTNDVSTFETPLRSYALLDMSDAALAKGRAHLQTVADNADTGATLDAIAERLFDSGLERVRVGIDGQDLVVEYENHRYNQNEADALGIVLGVASDMAPQSIERIHAVIKKANEPLADVAVDRAAYVTFLHGGSPSAASSSLTMSTGAGHAADAIAWHGDATRHGLTRIQISPVTSYLYGTDCGNFDISLGVSIQGFVPLWRGAEFYATYIAPIYNTKNMDDGRVYSQYRLRGGLSDVALAQSFWIVPRVFNVVSVGKMDFSYIGVQNETTAFVPGRPDLIRLRLAYLHREPGHEALPNEKNATLTYRWVQPAWKLWVEAGVAHYVGGDQGPLITFTRWFDDVSVSVHGEHSGKGSFVGASVSFPLTPRQGMKPGFTQISGPEQFALDFRTRVGSRNYLAGNEAENLALPYSTQQYLLNQGRFSAQYFGTQLYRMRDSYLRYVPARESPAKLPPTARSRTVAGCIDRSGESLCKRT